MTNAPSTQQISLNPTQQISSIPIQHSFSNPTSTAKLDTTKTLDNHHNQASTTKSFANMYIVLLIIYFIILFKKS